MERFRELEAEVREHYGDRFRTIWVNYCRISKRRGEWQLQIIVFPEGVDNPYRIITGEITTNPDLGHVTRLIDGEFA